MAELDDTQCFAAVVADLERQLGITGIRKVAQGLEFCILHGDLPEGPVAIKVPQDRVFSNVNDAYIDSRVLLDQEFKLMQHVRRHGVLQIPEPIRELTAAGFGAVVMSYVPSDNSEPHDYDAGQLLARLHAMEPPALALSAQEGCEIPELISNRLHRRWNELAAFVPDLPALPPAETLAGLLEEIRSIRQLLHMDFRNANFRTQAGDILAVVDWSNALLGHPALELARAAETGERGDMFLRGYASVTPLPRVSQRVEALLRLDTATMLALVFLSEAPDPARAPRAVERVRMLYKQLPHRV